MSIIRIYTDGSCLNNQQSKKGLSFGGYGCYIVYPNGVEEEFSAGISGPKVTNNIGEFMAYKCALMRMIEIDTPDICHVYTDSAYLINTFTKWAKDWEKNGWKKSNGKDVENVELIQEIYTLMNDSHITIILKKVKAHQLEPSRNSDNWNHWYGNDKVDKLAILCATDMKEAKETIENVSLAKKKVTIVKKVTKDEPELELENKLITKPIKKKLKKVITN
jgi:ribonuclease HI